MHSAGSSYCNDDNQYTQVNKNNQVIDIAIWKEYIYKIASKCNPKRKKEEQNFAKYNYLYIANRSFSELPCFFIFVSLKNIDFPLK